MQCGLMGLVDELDGLTGLTINLEDHIPRSEFVAGDCGSSGSEESLDDTIDRIIRENVEQQPSLLDVPTTAAPITPNMIPDSLPPVDHQAHQTPVVSSSLSMGSVVRMSMRARSSGEHHQAGRFKRPTVTPLAAHGSRMRVVEAQSPCPNMAGLSSSLFEEGSSQPEKDRPVPSTMPPLALFDLSGSLPPTAQLFPASQSSGRTLMEDYSFRTRTTGRTGGSPGDSLLVPATQFASTARMGSACVDAGEVVDTAKLLPTTPTIPTASSNEEIPPTQFPVSKAAFSCSQDLAANTHQQVSAGAMSQVDLFATNLVNTQGIEESIPGTLSLTDPSVAPSFSPAIIVTPDQQPIGALLLEEPEEDPRAIPYGEPYSGHEMVMLPDSLGEEDEEDNPFTVKEDPVVYSDVGRISEPPVLPSQAPPTQELDGARHGGDVPSQQQSTQEEPLGVLEVPRTGKKVKFAPTPVDSSQPPPPMAVAALYRTRTDTQEMEETFATSLLSKLSQQIVNLPKSVMTPVKDVEERLMADGDIEMKARTPLRIVSRGAVPIKPFASASKTLNRIIEAITPGKKMASSCVASRIASPCPRRVAKATPTAKRTLPTSKAVQSVKKQRASPVKKPSLVPKQHLAENTLSRQAIPDSTVLGEGLLVWAHWRLRYFTAGTVGKKKSSRREVWQVRPFHRTSTTLDLSADHMLPLVLLEPGDTVLHITDRRSYKVQKKQFSRFVPDEEADEGEAVLIEVEGGQRIGLKDVIIDRTVFTAKHKHWRTSISAPPSSDPPGEHLQDDPIDDDMENREPDTLNALQGTETRYSLTGVALFTGLSFLLTGSNDKSKIMSAIEEGGGTVVEDLTPDSLPDTRDLILISTDVEPCRTAKYYCAVLLGLERLKAGWIEASLKKGKLAPTAPYRLPPKASPKTTPTHLFSDTHLAFVGSKSYKTSCTQIATFTSASLVDPRRLASLKDRTVVVVLEAAEALTPRLQATCLSNGHLIAEKSWFTDSILQGRVLPLS